MVKVQIKLTKRRMDDLESLIKERNENNNIVLSEIIVQFRDEVAKYGYDYFDHLLPHCHDDYLNRNEKKSCSLTFEGSNALEELKTFSNNAFVQELIARAVELYFVTPKKYHTKQLCNAVLNIEQSLEILERHKEYEQTAKEIRLLLSDLTYRTKNDVSSQITKLTRYYGRVFPTRSSFPLAFKAFCNAK